MDTRPCDVCGQDTEADTDMAQLAAWVVCVDCEANPINPLPIVASCCAEIHYISEVQLQKFIDFEIFLYHDDCKIAGD